MTSKLIYDGRPDKTSPFTRAVYDEHLTDADYGLLPWEKEMISKDSVVRLEESLGETEDRLSRSDYNLLQIREAVGKLAEAVEEYEAVDLEWHNHLVGKERGDADDIKNRRIDALGTLIARASHVVDVEGIWQ